MIQTEMVERMARRLGITKKEAREAYHMVREEIFTALENGEDVWLRNFLHIEVQQVPGRNRTDPQGRTKHYPAQNRVLVRPGKDMKRIVGQRVREVRWG